MDQHTESGWKHDPTARREKCEMNFRNNLTAFSWKRAARDFDLVISMQIGGLPVERQMKGKFTPATPNMKAAAEVRRGVRSRMRLFRESALQSV